MLTPNSRALLQCVEVIPMEDEAFAVEPRAGILYHLNATARIILELLKSGASVEEVAQTFAAAKSIPPTQVTRDIYALLEGITRDHRASSDMVASIPCPEWTYPEPDTTTAYRIFGQVVRVDFPDRQVAATCHQLLAPLAVPPNVPNDLVVTFQEAGSDYIVTCGAAGLTVPRSAWAALFALQRVVLCHDTPDPGPFRVILHGGAVVGRKGAWLICGSSGHGKSTLVTRLDAAGLRVLGDDLIPLTPDDGLAFPLSLALSIKETGWSPVRRFRPDLTDAQPIVTTPIGKKVRYIAPINGPQDEDRHGHQVVGVLLPNRAAGARPAIEVIGLKQAMIALCDRFGRFPVEPKELRDLISLIADIPRYELVYDDVEDVMPELLRLL